MSNTLTAAAAAEASFLRVPVGSVRPVRVAVAGFGVVGQALVARLDQTPHFQVCAILVRDVERERSVAPPCPLTTERRAFLASEPDVLVDVLSCAETGALLSEWALARSIDLVSASKRVIAGCTPALADCAAASGARFLYSAAVGGETPILETVAAAAAEREVTSVAGIFNGTVNFILDRIARGLSFEAALKAAQAAGFAEADPSEDLSGADAAAKLRIVAATAFGGVPGDYEVAVDALDETALARIATPGERWVQVSRVDKLGGRVRGRVTLQPRSAAGPLPVVDGEWNCAVVTTADGFSRSCVGRGAGGTPTAGALLADLTRLTRAAHYA